MLSHHGDLLDERVNHGVDENNRRLSGEASERGDVGGVDNVAVQLPGGIRSAGFVGAHWQTNVSYLSEACGADVGSVD